MPKTTIEATELKDGEVNFVSLVKHGANRIPFRMTKGDTVFDISKLFRKSDPSPVVTRVVLEKSDDLDAQKTLLQALGFASEEMTVGDTYHSYTQAPQVEGEIALKLDDDTYLVVGHAQELVQKGFMGLGESAVEGNSFASQGFFPSFYNAVDMLYSMVWDAMADGSSSADAATSIAKICGDFQSYMTVLVQAIPQTAWKAEQEYRTLKAAKKAKPDAEDAKDGGADEADENADGKKMKKAEGEATTQKEETVPGLTDEEKAAVNAFLELAKKAGVSQYLAEITGKQVTDIQTVLGSADAGGELPAEVSRDQGSDYASGLGNNDQNVPPVATNPAIPDISTFLKSALAPMTEILSGLSDTVKKFDERLGTVEATANAAAETAKKAEEALGTTVIGSEASGDAAPKAGSQKSEWAGAPPLLDTAFSRA